MAKLKNPYAEPVDPWAVPEDRPADKDQKKTTTKQIGSLINALVLHVSLTKQAKDLDDTFPGLPGIREEGKNAQARAIEIMKDLLSRWVWE